MFAIGRHNSSSTTTSFINKVGIFVIHIIITFFRANYNDLYFCTSVSTQYKNYNTVQGIDINNAGLGN